MSRITCPIHTDTELKQTTKYGITIDWCPVCGGVWLDKGELEKMIEFAKQEATNSVSQSDANRPFSDDDNDNDNGHYRHGNNSHHKKRKFENPLEDLFDIF